VAGLVTRSWRQVVHVVYLQDTSKNISETFSVSTCRQSSQFGQIDGYKEKHCENAPCKGIVAGTFRPSGSSCASGVQAAARPAALAGSAIAPYVRRIRDRAN